MAHHQLIPFDVIKYFNTIQDPPPQHARVVAVCHRTANREDVSGLSRRNKVLQCSKMDSNEPYYLMPVALALALCIND